MFKIILRGIVNWTSGFGRYLDLLVAVIFLNLGYHWGNMWFIGFGILSGISFAIDFNGRFQRWMINATLSKAGNK